MSQSERRASPMQARVRRGQTIIVALAILFLLTLLGSIFVTSLIRNLQRVSRQTDTDEALNLALAGLKHAAEQFRTSEEGADWRPAPREPLWRTPSLAAVPPQRILDPDYEWLSDAGTYARPYTRIPTGRGRFLLRVSYLPSFKPAAGTSTSADEFDANSRWIHIEAIGRPGEFDPNDPTFLRDPTDTRAAAGQPTGLWRKVEAFVPVGVVDQLWWVTNLTNERGPATLGVPALRNAGFDPARPVSPINQDFQEYPLFLTGGIRSDTDLQIHGRAVIRVYPARGEAVQVKGRLTLAERGNVGTTPPPQVLMQVADDTGEPGPAIPPDQHDDNPANDSLIVTSVTQGIPEGPSGTPGFTPIPIQNRGGVQRYVVLDDQFTRSGTLATALAAAQSTRVQEAPLVDQIDPTSGVQRFLRLTRDSGRTLRVPDGSGTRLVNTGWYGLVDETPPPGPSGSLTQAQWEPYRAGGLYIDNVGEIQYPGDRPKVKNEWLRRGGPTQANAGWLGDYYVPSVVEGPTNHPITEIEFTRAPRVDSAGNPIFDSAGNVILRPVIAVTRWDLDQRQLNLSPATGRQRLLYQLSVLDPAAGTGTLVPVGQTRYYDLPRNGVIYCEGSVRVRGTLGINWDGTNPASRPRAVTLASGGTIYIEGNVLMNRNPGESVSGWRLALMARDYVTLNPTLFTRPRPGANVVVEADSWDASGNASTYHFTVPQGGSFDFSAASAAGFGASLLHVKHSALQQDATSETAVNLYMPFLGTSTTPWPDWYRDRYDFGGYPPPFPGTPPASPIQFFYLFRPVLAGTPANWAVSNLQSVAGSPANWERKSFYLPSVGAPAGHEALFRLHVGPQDGPDVDGDGFADPVMSPNGQPYWLSRVALMPAAGPLSIRVEAVIYAQTGSWFVIPPPFFNDDRTDSRAAFAANARRPNSSQPVDSADHPFYNEPLNIDIVVYGAITENMPAAPHEQAAWTSRLWLDNGYDGSAVPSVAPPAFRPNIRYIYDANLRRMVRVRNQRTGQETIAWAASGGALPTGVPLVNVLRTGIMTVDDSYADTLPLFPRLPASTVIYEGDPLQ